MVGNAFSSDVITTVVGPKCSVSSSGFCEAVAQSVKKIVGVTPNPSALVAPEAISTLPAVANPAIALEYLSAIDLLSRGATERVAR